METIIRSMTIEDYSAVKRLWQSIRGFGIRSIDDSEEGVRPQSRYQRSGRCKWAGGGSDSLRP